MKQTPVRLHLQQKWGNVAQQRHTRPQNTLHDKWQPDALNHVVVAAFCHDRDETEAAVSHPSAEAAVGHIVLSNHNISTHNQYKGQREKKRTHGYTATAG